MLIYDIIAENAQKRADSLMMVSAGDIRNTFGEFQKEVDACAVELIRHGCKPGDHIGIWSINSHFWPVAFCAIIRVGGVAVLMNYAYNYDDMKKLSELTDIKYLFCGPNLLLKDDPEAYLRLSRELKLDPRMAVISLANCLASDVTEEELAALDVIHKQDDPHRTALIIFTTGTTALPKAVMLSQDNIIGNAVRAYNIFGDDLGTGLCLALPLFHSYGLTMFFTYLYAGREIYLVSKIGVESIINLISAHRVPGIASVGAIYQALLGHPDFEEIVAPVVHFCCVGGGVSTPVQMMRMETSFKNALFFNGYGQTECAPFITLPHPTDTLEKRATTVGHAMPDTEVIISDGNGCEVPVGVVGEVLVRGYNVMNGYYKLPAENQAVDADGWLHTGDLGKFDEDGCLTLCGRIKDIIIRNGENISPSDIEKIIISFDDVTDAKVLGAPHSIWGESVEACVVPSNKCNFDVADIYTRLKDKLEVYKLPSHIFTYPVFPLNSNGKLDQRGLKADMLNKLQDVNIKSHLYEGICAFSLELQNTSYMIVPIAEMLESLAANMGYRKKDVMRIRLAVEEMVTERIANAYGTGTGIVTMKVLLLSDRLRITFTDDGTPFDLKTSGLEDLSAKIILKMVDNYETKEDDTGKSYYCMDFNYSEDFDILGFIQEHNLDAGDLWQ